MGTEASKEPSLPPSYETESPDGVVFPPPPEDTEESKEPGSNTEEHQRPSEGEDAIDPNRPTPPAKTSQPSDGLIALAAKAELCAYSHTSRHDCWAVANIKAPLYEPESRVPIDVVAVIDVSGSMGGEKLALVKRTLLFVITQRKCLFVF